MAGTYPRASGSGARRPRWLFPLILILLMAIVVSAIIALLAGPVEDLTGRLFFRYAIRYMPEKMRKEFYGRMANEVSGLYDPVPESNVGRVMQAGVAKTDRQVEVVSNNAGMRDRRPYLPASGAAYRIVCLGDSYVFGQGGKEEDRFSSQIEEILRRAGTTVDGKPIEVYSLGLPGWTAVNEATYLTSRLSAYDPDLILVLLVCNDISDTDGVTGVGTLTDSFSPERWKDGSGGCFVYLSNQFGAFQQNFLTYDLGPECRGRWEKAFSALRRLEALQTSRGKRMLLAVLERADFTPFVRYYHSRSGMTAPLIVVDHFSEKGTLLPHDPHPNRRGHEILALHFLHTLARRNWLAIDPGVLLPLPRGLSVEDTPPVMENEIAAWRRRMVNEYLPEGIDFRRFGKDDLPGLLGGFLPEHPSPRALESPPWGSVKSVLLLKRNPVAGRVWAEIEVPPAPELYPFELRMDLDGIPTATLHLERPGESGVHVIEGPLPSETGETALEIVLRTDSYLAGIDDHRMRSYRWLAVGQK